ncbi:hypothetical protein F5Y14DRAFT_430655 [Nemania sp. NC0429]|nr:hypothetical protein F5Y14DRAFT_430655 [Nemania sp. NC0429]
MFFCAGAGFRITTLCTINTECYSGYRTGQEAADGFQVAMDLFKLLDTSYIGALRSAGITPSSFTTYTSSEICKATRGMRDKSTIRIPRRQAIIERRLLAGKMGITFNTALHAPLHALWRNLANSDSLQSAKSPTVEVGLQFQQGHQVLAEELSQYIAEWYWGGE